MLAFFVYGYILYADERFAPAVKRSWPLMLAAGVLSSLFIIVGGATGIIYEWLDSPDTPGNYLF